MDLLDQLQQSFAMTASIIDCITPAQLGLPTPCDDWDVRRLLSHTIGVLDTFAAREPNPSAAARLEDDFAAQFLASATATLAAWRAPGALNGNVERPGRPPMPWSVFAGINLVDTFTHAWDLAQATGQQPKINEDLARDCLAMAQRVIPDDARAIVGFKPAQNPLPSQSASAQLAAFLGRATPA
jgi:uncharacterized protein (TIGR03086 family)